MVGIRGLLAALALGAMAVATLEAGAESKGTVKLALLDWTGQEITNKVAGGVLERMGYEVEYLSTTNDPMFLAIADGDIHAFMEQWLVARLAAFREYESKGQLVNLGETGIIGRETWYYPVYVEEECPGLPDWQALADCTELFATPETYPSGRVVDYPEEWYPKSPRWIETLGLDLVPISAGGEGAIVAEVRSAYTRRAPVLVMLWEPHSTFFDYDLRHVELPEWAPECETDPAWGPNPDVTGDCGSPLPLIIKVAWPGLEELYPEVWRFFEVFEMTNEMQTPMLKAVDVDGEEVDAVVARWLDENEDVWQAWIQQAQM